MWLYVCSRCGVCRGGYLIVVGGVISWSKVDGGFFCFFLSLAASRNGRLFIIRSMSCVFTYLCAYLVPSIPLVLNTLIYLLVNLHQDRVRAGEKTQLRIIRIHDLSLVTSPESTFKPKKNPHFFLPTYPTSKAANFNQYVHWLGGCSSQNPQALKVEHKLRYHT